jgi:HEPN domain-containing protein
MKRLTAEWVQKAEADFETATAMSGKSSRTHDVVCFHCQQSAEKYLKALLQERSLAFPRTHNLVSLSALLSPPDHARIRPLRRGLHFLMRYAVDIRYPGLRAKKRQANAALRWAGKVRAVCRSVLGI